MAPNNGRQSTLRRAFSPFVSSKKHSGNDGPPAQTLVSEDGVRKHARFASDGAVSSMLASHPSESETLPAAATPAQIDQLTAENERLRKYAKWAQEEVKNVHSVLQETKRQFSKFMRTRFALAQQVHKLDEEKFDLEQKLSTIKQEHNLALKRVTASLKEELKDVRLVLDKTTSDRDKTRTKLEESRELVVTLTQNLEGLNHANGSLQSKLAAAQKTIGQLSEERAKAQDLMEKHRKFSMALFEEVQPLRIKQAVTDREIAELKSTLSSETAALEKAHLQLGAIGKEKVQWQGRMDTLLHTTLASERRGRLLNHIASRRLHLEKERESLGPSVRRGANIISHSPSEEILKEVRELNGMILQVASILGPHLVTHKLQDGWSGNITRTKMVLGAWMSSAVRTNGFSQKYFLQSVIQMLLVDWSRAIIEAWYPKQKTFAEIFLHVASTHPQGVSNGNDAVRFQLLQMNSNGSTPPDIQAWAEEILDDLLQIIPLPGTGLMPHVRTGIILPSLVALSQKSYDIRLALAEEDICGNLEILVYPSDTQYLTDTMDVSSALGRQAMKNAADDMGDIAGTVGIGLREVQIQKGLDGVSSIEFKILLPPSVILAREIAAGMHDPGQSAGGNIIPGGYILHDDTDDDRMSVDAALGITDT